MSGYTATLEDCADSIFNKEKSLTPLSITSCGISRKAWGLYKEIQSLRKGFEDLLRAVNKVLTGDENASFYALDTLFIERAYLMDDSEQSTFQEILNCCVAEEKKIRHIAEQLREIADTAGAVTSFIIRRTLAELSLALEAIDSCVFALEEVISYAKSLREDREKKGLSRAI